MISLLTGCHCAEVYILHSTHTDIFWKLFISLGGGGRLVNVSLIWTRIWQSCLFPVFVILLKIWCVSVSLLIVWKDAINTFLMPKVWLVLKGKLFMILRLYLHILYASQISGSCGYLWCTREVLINFLRSCWEGGWWPRRASGNPIISFSYSTELLMAVTRAVDPPHSFFADRI